MQFEYVYSDAALMRTADKYPSILAIGDAWIWYPFPGGSLLNNQGPLVATCEHVIHLRPRLADHCVGCATAADCFREGSEKGRLDWLLARTYATALLHSSTRSSARPGRRPERPPIGIKQHDVRPGRVHDHSTPLRE
jgi:hypothetical protein